MAFEDGAGGAAAGSGGDGGAAGGAAGGDGGVSASALLAGAAAGAAAGGGDGAAAGQVSDGGQGGQQGDGTQGSGGPDPEWYNHLSAEADNDSPSARDWIKAKGFKTLDDLAKSYRSAEQAIRDSGRVKVPGEGASDAERAAFHKAIGVPDDAKGYQVEQPKDADGNPVPLNTPLIERLAEAAHKAGVPKAGFEALAGDFIKAQLDQVADEDAEQQRLADKTVKDWGGDAQAKLAAVDSAARSLGLSKDELVAMRGALGADRTLGLLAKLGEGMQEDVLLTGGKGRFGVTGAEAQAEIDRLTRDPAFQAKVMIKGSPERQRWDRLQAAVGAEAERKARAEA